MSALPRQSSAPPTLRSHAAELQRSQGRGRGSGEEKDGEGDADDRPLPKYGEGPDYWSDRYTQDPEPFEWLKSYAELQELIEILTQGHREVKVLNIGCGNSLLAEDMYDEGYHDVVNVDNSSVVIEQMQTRNQQHERPGLSWLCMDATSMSFADGQFDFVFDKSLLDTFVCGASARLVVATYLKEVSRVLTPMGVLLCVSYGEPSSRLSFFEFPHLLFEVSWLDLPCTEGSKQQHYAYVCMKTEFADEMREKYWPQVLEILAPEGDAAPEGDSVPEGNLAKECDLASKGDKAPEGDPAPGGDLAPGGDQVLRGDPAPGSDLAPERDRAPKGDEAREGDPAPEGVLARGGDPIPEGDPAPKDNLTPEGDPASKGDEAPEGDPAPEGELAPGVLDLEGDLDFLSDPEL